MALFVKFKVSPPWFFDSGSQLLAKKDLYKGIDCINVNKKIFPSLYRRNN